MTRERRKCQRCAGHGVVFGVRVDGSEATEYMEPCPQCEAVNLIAGVLADYTEWESAEARAKWLYSQLYELGLRVGKPMEANE